jgi:hypothetical protein
MSETQASSYTLAQMRVILLAFACILGCLAGWILIAEAVRPKLITVGGDPHLDVARYARRDAAILVARVGLVRGDLWSEAALAYADMLLGDDRNTPKADLEEAKAVTEQAIAHAPYDSRLWLLLAAGYRRLNPLDERASAALKMSYYTGANVIAVLPHRLVLSVQSRAIADPEFQELVRDDIRLAAARKSQLISALVTAYTGSSAPGRELINKTLSEFDPSVLALVRSAGDQR